MADIKNPRHSQLIWVCFCCRKPGEIKSKKAIIVCQQAPTSCHIWFVCRGSLIYTRCFWLYKISLLVCLVCLFELADHFFCWFFGCGWWSTELELCYKSWASGLFGLFWSTTSRSLDQTDHGLRIYPWDSLHLHMYEHMIWMALTWILKFTSKTAIVDL